MPKAVQILCQIFAFETTVAVLMRFFDLINTDSERRQIFESQQLSEHLHNSLLPEVAAGNWVISSYRIPEDGNYCMRLIIIDYGGSYLSYFFFFFIFLSQRYWKLYILFMSVKSATNLICNVCSLRYFNWF